MMNRAAPCTFSGNPESKDATAYEPTMIGGVMNKTNQKAFANDFTK